MSKGKNMETVFDFVNITKEEASKLNEVMMLVKDTLVNIDKNLETFKAQKVLVDQDVQFLNAVSEKIGVDCFKDVSGENYIEVRLALLNQSKERLEEEEKRQKTRKEESQTFLNELENHFTSKTSIIDGKKVVTFIYEKEFYTPILLVAKALGIGKLE